MWLLLSIIVQISSSRKNSTLKPFELGKHECLITSVTPKEDLLKTEVNLNLRV